MAAELATAEALTLLLEGQQQINKQQTALLQQLFADKKKDNGWTNKDTRYHTKGALAGFQTATPLHGLGGIFSTPGLSRDVITAHVRPMGIGSVLPTLPSIEERPYYSILTGYTATDGVEPTQSCEDAPAGYMKSCVLTTKFGLTRRDTQTIEFDKTMLKVNRGDFTDLQLRGQVLGLTGLEPGGLNQQQILSIITMSEMVGAAVQAERKLVKDFWQGTLSNGAGFRGLDLLINTGIVDAETDVACPAVDSDIKDFTFDNVAGGGKSIVEYLSSMESYIFHNASRMGLLPLSAAFVMRPELWDVLLNVWPCQYNTGQCATAVIGDASRVVIDGRENVEMSNRMRDNMTLTVNGRTYPVILDDGIYEKDSTNTAGIAAGSYASSIYFVPLAVNGNFPVLYREFLNYRSAEANANLALLNGTGSFWTDGGIYSWAVDTDKWCYKFNLKTEQRIILRTPHLAGKLQNVRYAPLQHLRSAFPESGYFKDGGVSTRPIGTVHYE